MTIRAKLALALGAITVTLLVPLLFALQALGDVHQANRDLLHRELQALLLITHTRGATDQMRADETAMVLVYDSTVYAQLLSGMHYGRLFRFASGSDPNVSLSRTPVPDHVSG